MAIAKTYLWSFRNVTLQGEKDVRKQLYTTRVRIWLANQQPWYSLLASRKSVAPSRRVYCAPKQYPTRQYKLSNSIITNLEYWTHTNRKILCAISTYLNNCTQSIISNKINIWLKFTVFCFNSFNPLWNAVIGLLYRLRYPSLEIKSLFVVVILDGITEEIV